MPCDIGCREFGWEGKRQANSRQEKRLSICRSTALRDQTAVFWVLIQFIGFHVCFLHFAVGRFVVLVRQSFRQSFRRRKARRYTWVLHVMKFSSSGLAFRMSGERLPLSDAEKAQGAG